MDENKIPAPRPDEPHARDGLLAVGPTPEGDVLGAALEAPASAGSGGFRRDWSNPFLLHRGWTRDPERGSRCYRRPEHPAGAWVTRRRALWLEQRREGQ